MSKMWYRCYVKTADSTDPELFHEVQYPWGEYLTRVPKNRFIFDDDRPDDQSKWYSVVQGEVTEEGFTITEYVEDLAGEIETFTDIWFEEKYLEAMSEQQSERTDALLEQWREEEKEASNGEQ
jgi:hypothetical protein